MRTYRGSSLAAERVDTRRGKGDQTWKSPRDPVRGLSYPLGLRTIAVDTTRM